MYIIISTHVIRMESSQQLAINKEKGLSIKKVLFQIYKVYSINFWVKLLLLPLDGLHILHRSIA